MRILRLKRTSLPKIAVLLAGLAGGVLAFTLSPQAAHAYPSRAVNCAGCHTARTSTATTATASTTTPGGGATYTVAITLAANPSGGKSGYAIVPFTAGTGATNAGNIDSRLSYTATMTAPTTAGTYSYTVYTNMGSQATGQTGSAIYTITVAAGPTTVPPTTVPPTTAPPTTAPPTTVPPTTAPPTTAPPTTVPPVAAGVHGPYTINSAQCGTCHRVHTAQAPNLLAKRSATSLGSQSTLCLSCHDGTGAAPAAGNQYGLVRPVNNATAREYYSHDAVGATPVVAHTESKLNEFGGVTNRHSECSDCHNPHQATVATSANSNQTATGWDATRRLAGVSGVSVVNGAAGAAPTYTFLSGVDTNVVSANLVTREYQLCFKCHSGFTTLTSNAGLQAAVPPQYAQYSLDKAIEFNPANLSFHPIEAPGKNQTAKMAASLAGTSPYKLWNFTVGQTVRCLNCHASSSTSGPNPPLAVVDPALPQPGTALAPHTSANRGILLRNYKDRVLKTSSAAYSAGDFALCYMCHAEEPFKNETGTATNFGLHGYHITKLTGMGSALTDINTPGAGGGNAICAECHFRLHSTAFPAGTQTLSGSRLVSFAPNVRPYNGTRSWTRNPTSGSGSCTLTCHGVPHTPKTYSGAP